MKLLVTGTRHADMGHSWDIYQAIIAITGQPQERAGCTIYVGDAEGVDTVTRQILTGSAGALWSVREFEAHWEECGAGCPPRSHRKARRSGEPYCPYAGPRRNKEMVRAFVADGGTDGLTLPARGMPSTGTWGCAREAADLGVLVRVQTLKVGGRRG